MLTKTKLISEIRTCLFLALPLAGAQLAQSATAFVDTVMMGLLGSETIAAGSLGATTFNALLLIATGIISAVSPLVAEAYGAQRREQVGQVVRQGLWLAVILGIPLTLFVWQAGPLLRIFGQEPKTVAVAETYLRAISWGYIPGLGFAVLRSFVTALSQPRIVMLIVILGTLINIAGNYILMFGKLGLPALGLAGIGWASALSLWSMFIALVGYSLTQTQLKHYRILQNWHQFEGRIFWELIRVGLPIGGLVGVEAGLFTVVTFLMGQLGTVTLAAHQIALQTAAITFMIALGVSLATTVRVGQLIGQGDPRAVRLSGFIGITIGALFMGSMGIIFWLVPETIVSLYLDIYNPANAEVVELAKKLLGVAAVFQLADGVQVVASGALRGLKDTRIPFLIGLLSYWCLGLTSGYILGMRLGFEGVGLWYGLVIGLAFAATILTWRFSWQSSKLLWKP